MRLLRTKLRMLQERLVQPTKLEKQAMQRMLLKVELMLPTPQEVKELTQQLERPMPPKEPMQLLEKPMPPREPMQLKSHAVY